MARRKASPKGGKAAPRRREEAAAELRTVEGASFPVGSGTALETQAMRWAYTVRNRRRWAGDAEAEEDLDRQAGEALAELGLGEDALDAIAASRLVEVRVPFTEESVGWEARVLPWEFVLGAATRERRRDTPLVVVRHLSRDGAAVPVLRPARALLVVSAPGRLGEIFSFDQEQKLIKASLQPAKGKPAARMDVRVLENPTLRALERTAVEVLPDVIHFAGIDAHQGAELLGEPPDRHRRDGLYLAAEDGSPVAVDAETLAAAVNAAPDHRVRLVTFNMNFTAARVAALAVAGGAAAAVGLQDELDETLAETFFADFHHLLSRSDWDLLRAFRLAFETLRRGPGSPRRGSGVVLWSDDSLLSQAAASPRERNLGPLGKDRLLSLVESEAREQAAVPPSGTGDGGVASVLEVDPMPYDTVNYSLLHNGRSLFRWFKLRKLTPGELRGVEVAVELHVGSAVFPYRASVVVRERIENLADDIRVPLTWDEVRGLRESARTTLFVDVSCRGEVIYRNTFSVTLLPVEEWRDNRRDGAWLPSFVLPRDPAVEEIVLGARRYLRALTDDPHGGFDGYQGLVPGAADPYAAVDLQVRALWTALLLDLDLGYVGPPPTYSAQSQRLRSPGTVVAGRVGTCIDLALLFASCLEYVNLLPVLFLLRGHAFAGYWRDEGSHRRFVEMSFLSSNGGPLAPSEAAGVGGQEHAWMVEGPAWGELVALVQRGVLIPVETTLLAAGGGFESAYEEAVRKLKDRGAFDALIDITLARRRQVTPLPLA